MIDKNLIKERVKKVIVGVLKHDDISMSDDSTAADVEGWDSLTHMIIITEVEKEFGIRFKLKELNKLTNMGNLLELIQVKLTEG